MLKHWLTNSVVLLSVFEINAILVQNITNIGNIVLIIENKKFLILI